MPKSPEVRLLATVEAEIWSALQALKLAAKRSTSERLRENLEDLCADASGLVFAVRAERNALEIREAFAAARRDQQSRPYVLVAGDL